jgi:hypothetical protein
LHGPYRHQGYYGAPPPLAPRAMPPQQRPRAVAPGPVPANRAPVSRGATGSGMQVYRSPDRRPPPAAVNNSAQRAAPPQPEGYQQPPWATRSPTQTKPAAQNNQ